MNTHDDKPVRDARAALLELRSLGIEKPARAQMLLSRLGLALDDVAADAHMEAFVALFLLMKARREGGIPADLWTRAWDATDALTRHYGIGSVDDVMALDAELRDRRELKEAA